MRVRDLAGVWADSWPAIPVARGRAMLVKNVLRSIGANISWPIVRVLPGGSANQDSGRGLDLEERAVVFVGQQIEQPVGALANLTDALVQLG